jgi:nitrogen-specific signal transduction histidine kinase
MRDMTERKREEEARRESERKLAALQKMESLGLLAGGVAHDLNNVLSGIVGYPDLILLHLPEDSDLRKPIQRMQEAGRRAAAIVADLLTLARGAAIRKEPLDLNAVIEEYLASPEYEKTRHFYPEVSVRTHLAPDLVPVSGSRIHMRKLVMNLLNNACEAIEVRGEVVLSTENRTQAAPEMDSPHGPPARYAFFSVKDNGSGIPEEDLERIFEPFYTKKVMGRSGTGLGLAVVWNVVKEHDGQIHVASNRQGTEFELYFPASQQTPETERPQLSIKEISGNGESVLIVDDMESQRNIASGMMQQLGYRPVCAPSGEAAIEYLKDQTADIMILDMIMDPGIGGRETYEEILRIRPGQKAVIVSGYAETADVKETRKLGAGAFVKKPYSLREIGAAIKSELKQ